MNNATYILAYNIANAAKITVYGLNYSVSWEELTLRQMTQRALDLDADIGELTTPQRDCLEAKMNLPYNN